MLYCIYIFINAHLHNHIGTTMSNIQYTHTAVLPSQFNANGTNLHWAKLQSSEVCELIKQNNNNNNCLVSTQSGQSQDNCLSEPPPQRRKNWPTAIRLNLEQNLLLITTTFISSFNTHTLHLASLRAPLILKLNHIHLNLHLLPTYLSSIPYHPI